MALQCRHLVPALNIWAWMHGWPHNWTWRRLVSYVGHWCVWLIFEVLSMDVCTARHWQTYGRLVHALNVCTVCALTPTWIVDDLSTPHYSCQPWAPPVGVLMMELSTLTPTWIVDDLSPPPPIIPGSREWKTCRCSNEANPMPWLPLAGTCTATAAEAAAHTGNNATRCCPRPHLNSATHCLTTFSSAAIGTHY